MHTVREQLAEVSPLSTMCVLGLEFTAASLIADDFTCCAISAAHQTKILSRFFLEVQVYFLICVSI